MTKQNELRMELAVRITIIAIFTLVGIASVLYSLQELLHDFFLGIVPFVVGLWMLTKFPQLWKSLDNRDKL
jgi:hypothetical protein